MTPYSQPSRNLAEQLRAGDHALTNQQLRQIYGMSRVTAKARGEVAQELRRAGLQVLSDPATEPLWVRKVAPARAPVAPREPRKPSVWWRRPWAIGVAAAVLLVLFVASLGGEPSSTADATEQAALSAATETPTSEPTVEPTPTAAAAETLADAREAVADDEYAAALVIAAAFGKDDERAIERRIARRLAYRASKALGSGDRSRASRLLRQAHGHALTAEVRRADRKLDAAQARARARAAAKRQAQAVARAARRARVEARRQARAEARRRDQAVQSAPAAPSTSEPSMSGPSTFNWCGKRDGDGDGIYCEGM